MKQPQILQMASESTNLPLKYSPSSLRSERGLMMHTGPWGKAVVFQRKSLMKQLLLRLCQPRSMWPLVLVSDRYLREKKEIQVQLLRQHWADGANGAGLVRTERLSSHGLNLDNFMSQSLWAATGMVKACKVFWGPLRSSRYNFLSCGGIRNSSYPVPYGSSHNTAFSSDGGKWRLFPHFFTVGFDCFVLGKVVWCHQARSTCIALQTFLPWHPCKGPHRRQTSVGPKTPCWAPSCITPKSPLCSQEAKITFGETERLERACW